MRSTSAHHEFHVVLDQQDGQMVGAQRTQQFGELELFLAAQAGGRLVEHEQRRIGRQRAGDLEHALVAERQIAGKFERLFAEADPFELPHRLVAGAGFFRLVQAQRAGEQAGPGARIGAEQHVVEQRHARAQLDVLEGARDSGAGDLELLVAR